MKYEPQEIDNSPITSMYVDVRTLMPDWDEMPKDFRRHRGNKWVELVSGWFFEGLNTTLLIPKNGIDKGKALTHCSVIMGSWSPKHEHKIGSVAYLMSLWFEDVVPS